jgi:hypothetical protein
MEITMPLLESPGRPPATLPDEERLCSRIRAEFREMPGLTLTLAQAARLFSVDRARCERVLTVLVQQGHLATNGTTFATARDGRRAD